MPYYMNTKLSIKRTLVGFTCISMVLFLLGVVKLMGKQTMVDMREINRNRKNAEEEDSIVVNQMKENIDTHENDIKKQDNVKKNSRPQCNNDGDSKKQNAKTSSGTRSNTIQKRHSQDDFPYRTIDTHAYHYVSDPKIWTRRCADLSLLTYIHSAINYPHKRMAIRSTWGSRIAQDKLDMKLVFMVGTSRNPAENAVIKLENEQYGDIIQEDYTDTYYNISLKAVSALKFIHRYCPNVRMILKADDDIYVNIPKLVTYLQTHLPQTYINTDKFLICNKKTSGPVRGKSKWGVSVTEYKYINYPPFCQGAAYLISPHAARAILDVANGHEFFKLDDVFVTGILAEKVGVARVGINNYYGRNGDKFMFSIQAAKRFEEYWARHVKVVEGLPDGPGVTTTVSTVTTEGDMILV